MVHFPSGWTPLTGGVEAVAIDAPRVVEMLAALESRFPDLREHLATAAVAIDGRIFQHARYEPLAPTSEVHLLPPVSGG
jgi:molybdopterin converting factor small subunit